MRFSIADLKAARFVESEESMDARFLGEPPSHIEFRHPIKTSVRARLADANVLVNGDISTVLTLTCSRCLEKFDRQFGVHFDQQFGQDLPVVDVTDEVREAVLIELPYSCACRETCKGLCPTCGTNRNVRPCKCAQPTTDARWDALKNLKIQ